MNINKLFINIFNNVLFERPRKGDDEDLLIIVDACKSDINKRRKTNKMRKRTKNQNKYITNSYLALGKLLFRAKDVIKPGR